MYDRTSKSIILHICEEIFIMMFVPLPLINLHIMIYFRVVLSTASSCYISYHKADAYFHGHHEFIMAFM